MHVAHFVHRSALRHPDRPLWIGDGLNISYSEGSLRLNRIANSLLALGEQGDRVAILSANRFEAYEIYLAAMNAGMAAVPLNPKVTLAENVFAITDSGARFVVYSPEYAEVLKSGRAEMGVVRYWIEMGPVPEASGDGPVRPYAWLVENGAPDAPDIAIEPDQLAWLFYTSGTTGKPKGAMETHRNLVTMVQQFRQTLLSDMTETDVMYHIAPIAHGTASVGLAHLSAGAAQLFHSGSFDADRLFAEIQKHRVTGSFMAPTMVQMLLQSKNVANYDLSSLKNVIYGGGPMYVEVLKEAIQTFGKVFSQIYGQGEAPMTCTGLHKREHDLDDPVALRRLGSAGQEMPAVMVRIVDAEDNPVGPGVAGEIVVRSDLVIPGYWNRPDATAETIRNGWLHTGDVGYLDEDGYLFITDRIKDLIISGGANIYPREVEEAILEHPAVAEVSVFGIPDEKWGESVKAVVVLRPGKSAGAEELIDLVRERIGSFKKPKSVDFVDSLPKNAFGKVLKRDLRAPYWDGRARSI